MFAQKQDTAVTLDCKVACQENHCLVIGTFQSVLAFALTI